MLPKHLKATVNVSFNVALQLLQFPEKFFSQQNPLRQEITFPKHTPKEAASKLNTPIKGVASQTKVGNLCP